MALQVRRGTNAERLAITPLEGELIYVTDTKQLYVGDGTTLGGTTTTQNTIDSLLADSTPQLGGTLDLNGNDITGTGNINIAGTITATGNINLGDGAGGDSISVGGVINGDLIPNADSVHDLGSNTNFWKEAFIEQLTVDSQITAERISGDIIADDSTVVFNASTGQVAAEQVSGTFTGAVVGNVTGNVVGNTEGYHTGDVTGSIFALDSNVMVDAISGIVRGTRVQTVVLENDTGDLRVEANGNTVKLSNNVQVQSTDAVNAINFSRTESSGAIGTEATIGRLNFSVNDTDGSRTPFSIDANKTYITVFPNPTGTPDYTKFFQVYNNGKTQIGGEAGGSGYDGFSREPDASLEVYGNVKISGANELLLGNMTTTERNALTPANGMIIYNTTDNKFQGYENGAWANLI